MVILWINLLLVQLRCNIIIIPNGYLAYIFDKYNKLIPR